MKSAIKELGEDRVEALVTKYAQKQGGDEIENLMAILNACFRYNDLCQDMQTKRTILTAEERIEKWVLRYYNALKNRISRRISKMPSTRTDGATVTSILQARMPHLTFEDCNRIIYAHRLSMSIENIQGLFLEEYLSLKMRPYGWHMAWGETLVAADMCSDNGDLLQVKSQDNTENSSSDKIRIGTSIHKWFRRKSRTGETMWPELCEIVGSPMGYMSEKEYQDFIHNAITQNPMALPVELQNPWLN